MTEIEYQAEIETQGDDLVRVVFRSSVHGRRMLRHYREVRNHAAGFAWGTDNSLAAQLALAMLCDAVGRERALPLYRQFHRDCILRLPADKPFTMTRPAVREWVQAAEAPAMDARAAYRDDTFPERHCDYCGEPYRGPAVYCSWECAQADAV